MYALFANLLDDGVVQYSMPVEAPPNCLMQAVMLTFGTSSCGTRKNLRCVQQRVQYAL